MLKLICSRCPKEEVFFFPSKPDEYKGVLHPKTDRKVDLCVDCRENYKKMLENSYQRYMEDLKKSVDDFWKKDLSNLSEN